MQLPASTGPVRSPTRRWSPGLVLRLATAAALLVATLVGGSAEGQVIIRRGALNIGQLRVAGANPAGTPAAAAADHRGPAEPFGDDAVTGALSRARERVAESDWGRAIDAYDEVLDSLIGGASREAHRVAPPPENGEGEMAPEEGPEPEPEDAEEEPPVTLSEVLISVDDVGYLPLDAAVRRELVALPDEARQLFERTHSAAAEQALEAALTSRGSRARSALRDVGMRYPLTTAGAEAWQLLGLRALDRGRYDEAARALDTRLELPMPRAADAAEVLAQAAWAHLLAGRLTVARRRLDLLERDYAAEVVPVLGQPVAVGELREHLLFRDQIDLAAARQPLDVGADDRWPARGGSFSARAVPLSDDALPVLGSEAGWSFPPQQAAAQTNVPAPAVVAGLGMLFVRGPSVMGGQVVALDPASGKIRWLSGEGFGGVARTSSRGGSIGAAGIVLYSTAGAPEDALVIGIDQPVGMTQRRRGGFRPGANQLVAWHARSGKLVWKVSGERRPEVGGGNLGFLGPPVVTSAGLAVPTAGPSSLSVTGISSGGRIAWHRRLYDHGTVVRYGGAIGTVSGRTLAAGGDLIVATPGHGVAFALDAHSGEIRWAIRYMSRAARTRLAAGWRYGRPCIVGDLVVLTPDDSEFATAIDAATGAIVWERRMDRGVWTPVGPHGDTFLYAGSELRALDLADGSDRWAVPLTDDKRLPSGVGFLASERVYIPVLGSEILVRSALDGSPVESIRLLDPRLGGDTARVLVPFGGRLFVSRKAGVDALLPSAESWSRLADSRDDPLARAVLLRAEGKPAEALTLLHDIIGKLPRGRARDEARKQLVAAARETALATRDPAPIAALLENAGDLVPEEAARTALELLQIDLLLESDQAEARATAAAKLGELTRAEPRVVAAPDQTRVDVATYAGDLLRELYRGSNPLPGEARPPSLGEEAARAVIAKGASDAALVRIVIQQPQIDASASALAHLARRAEERGSATRAADLLDLLRYDFPALAANAALRERAAELRRRADNGASRLPALPPALAGETALVPHLTIDRDDGLMAASAPGAPLSPVLFSLAGESIRIYEPSGRVLTERELPEYPDVEDARRQLRTGSEEPLLVWCDGSRAVLYTAAGVYAFRAGKASPEAATPRERLATAWRNCRLVWAQTYPHPLSRSTSGRSIGFGRGITVPVTAYARAALGEGDTILALPDGSLWGVGSANGKRRWAEQLPAGPGGPWGRGAGVLELALASGRALAIVDPLAGPDAKRGERVRVVEAPEKGATHANAVAAGLVAVFGGAHLWVVDSFSGRLLWKTARSGHRFVRAVGGELWVSGMDGRLQLRALRSGRVRKTVELPGGATVLECLPAPASSGAGAVTLIALGTTGHSNAGATGADLWVLRLSRDAEVLSQRLLRSGQVVYAGCPVVASDGALLLLFNHGADDGRWYTELVRVEADEEPGGKADDEASDAMAAPRVIPLAKVEVEGKGQEVPPRLCLLEDGVAIANAGGFAWLLPPPADEEADVTVETAGSDTAGSDTAGSDTAGSDTAGSAEGTPGVAHGATQ